MKNINIDDITVYKSPYEKKRYGRPADGGYVAVKLPCKYDVLLSGGIANDVTFECDLLDDLDIPHAYLYDHTITQPDSNWPLEESLKNNPQFSDKRINIIPKNIGHRNIETETNLNDTMRDFDNIFIKMDIEAHEFRWLRSLTPENMNKIDQMVVEVHFHPDITEQAWSIFELINKTHVLVHVHANNWDGLRSYSLVDGRHVPKVPECTYIHKKYVDDLQVNDVPLPCDIDMINFSHQEELSLAYEPFYRATI